MAATSTVFLLSFLVALCSSFTHDHYIAVQEVLWDYAPQKPLNGVGDQWLSNGTYRIGSIYKKAVYVEYQDASFTTVKPKSPEFLHVGLLGPVLRGEVGDMFRIFFWNNGTFNYSLHPHGVFYDKSSEGALMRGLTDYSAAVPPGGFFTYIWEVPERAGPGVNDLSSILWMYHSHADEMADSHTGLIGPIIINRAGTSRTPGGGRPEDIDKEFILLFHVFDEMKSSYLLDNLNRSIFNNSLIFRHHHEDETTTMTETDETETDSNGSDNSGSGSGSSSATTSGSGSSSSAATGSMSSHDLSSMVTSSNSEHITLLHTLLKDPSFLESNLKRSINGYMFNNLEGLNMNIGDHVRWYLLSIGGEKDVHAATFDEFTVVSHARRADVINLLPAQMVTADAIIDSVRNGSIHCHNEDHFAGGMQASFTVNDEFLAFDMHGSKEYFVAAEEVLWDYAPVKPSNGVGDKWLLNSSNRIGSIFKKVRYVEYTDGNFTTVKTPTSESEHLGLLGPILRAQVGDMLRVTFKNMASRSYNFRPHGLMAFGNTVTEDRAEEVLPGEVRLYEWYVPARSGPAANDLSSIMWMYHSAVNPLADLQSGLIGGIIITRSAIPVDHNGKPNDIDREFVMLWQKFDESKSHYLLDNINRALPNVDINTLLDQKFNESILMHSVNGLMFGNLKGLDNIRMAETVRWHLFGMGSTADVHTIHIHGQTGIYDGARVDTLALLPAAIRTIDTLISTPGSWMINCQVNEHWTGGMMANFNVTSFNNNPRPIYNTVHDYFIAAEEVMWDYAPIHPKEEDVAPWLNPNNESFGTIYKKARYVEYTDASFVTVKPQTEDFSHLGLLGPVLRGQVGSLIRIIFKNKASVPYSMHPHGLYYDKTSEGSFFPGVTNTRGAVESNGYHVYEWFVTEAAGPSKDDPSSIIWLYHSDVSEVADTQSGLVGPIIVTRAGTDVDEKGKPKDVDREFILLFTLHNELRSHYLQDHVSHWEKNMNLIANHSNLYATFYRSTKLGGINGKLFNNLPGLNMAVNERVRWYIVALGGVTDVHTVHIHAQTTLRHGERSDVLALLPFESYTLDVIIDTPGDFLLHCHVDEHMMQGMVVSYTASPSSSSSNISLNMLNWLKENYWIIIIAGLIVFSTILAIVVFCLPTRRQKGFRTNYDRLNEEGRRTYGGV